MASLVQLARVVEAEEAAIAKMFGLRPHPFPIEASSKVPRKTLREGRRIKRETRRAQRRARLGGKLRDVAQPTIDSAGDTMKTSVREAVDDGVKNIRSAADDAGRDLRANVRRETTRGALKLAGGLGVGLGVGASAPVAVHHSLRRTHSSERA